MSWLFPEVFCTTSVCWRFSCCLTSLFFWSNACHERLEFFPGRSMCDLAGKGSSISGKNVFESPIVNLTGSALALLHLFYLCQLFCFQGGHLRRHFLVVRNNTFHASAKWHVSRHCVSRVPVCHGQGTPEALLSEYLCCYVINKTSTKWKLRRSSRRAINERKSSFRAVCDLREQHRSRPSIHLVPHCVHLTWAELSYLSSTQRGLAAEVKTDWRYFVCNVPRRDTD